MEEEEDREQEQTSKRDAHKLEAQLLVLPGTLSSLAAAADDDAAADATYTVNEAIDHMGKSHSALQECLNQWRLMLYICQAAGRDIPCWVSLW